MLVNVTTLVLTLPFSMESIRYEHVLSSSLEISAMLRVQVAFSQSTGYCNKSTVVECLCLEKDLHV